MKFFLSVLFFVNFNIIFAQGNKHNFVIDEIFVDQIVFKNDYYSKKTPEVLKKCIDIQRVDSLNLWNVSYSLIEEYHDTIHHRFIYGIKQENKFLGLSEVSVHAIFLKGKKILGNYDLYHKLNYFNGPHINKCAKIQDKFLSIYEGEKLTNVVNIKQPTFNFKGVKLTQKNIINDNRKILYDKSIFDKILLPINNKNDFDSANYFFVNEIHYANKHYLIVLSIESETNRKLILLENYGNKIVSLNEIGEIQYINKKISYLKLPIVKLTKNELSIASVDNYGETKKMVVCRRSL